MYFRKWLKWLILKDKNEMDFLSFILEIADKSPAIEHLKDEQVEDLASCSFYIPDSGSNEVTDFLGMSWLLHAALLSLPTNEKWDSSTVVIARMLEEGHREERFTLDNISKVEHGSEISARNKALEHETLSDTCPNSDFSPLFTEWLDDQESKNYQIIFKKLKLASQLNFQGGLPLFDTLNNADGMREIRFSAHQGGAIRIFFKALPDNKQAILLGFIKKSDTEGYENNIDRAQELLEAMQQKN